MENNKEQKTQSNTGKIVIVVVILLIVLAGAALLILPGVMEKHRQSVIEENLSLGQKYLSESDYENAVAAFTDVIEVDDKNMTAYLGLGEAYSKLEKWQEAADSYNNVISIDDQNTEAYIGLGNAYSGLEEWGSSVDNYNHAIKTLIDLVVVDASNDANVNLPDRKAVMDDAKLADTEYMTDDELRLIAVVTDGEDQSGSEEQETEETVNYSARDIWNIIYRRNRAMEDDITELEKTGGDTAKYSDFLNWIVTLTVQVVDPYSKEPIPDADVFYPKAENPAISEEAARTDSDGLAQITVRNRGTVTLTIERFFERMTTDIDVNTDGSDTEPVQILFYPDISDINAEVVEERKAQFNGHTYCLITPETETYWSQAAAICEELGGHLLTITSAEEKDFILEYLSREEIHKNVGAWPVNIGAYRIDEDDTWKWVNGEDAGYLNGELLGEIVENWYEDRTDLHIIKLQVSSWGSEKEGYSLEASWWEENTHNAIGFVIEWDS